MNNWHNEFMAEYDRQQVLKETEQIRLEKLAFKSRLYHPGVFERTMFNFANWMIVTGKQLRKRYTRSSPVDEIPAVPCNHSPTGSLVR